MDPSTLSSPTLTTQHISLHLTPSFPTRRIHGKVVLRLLALKATPLIALDTRALDIHTVFISSLSSSPKFTLSAPSVLGSCLTIHQSMREGEVCEMEIEYTVSEYGTAVQWLDAQQTKGGKMPYLVIQ
jgi:hypothetical protein